MQKLNNLKKSEKELIEFGKQHIKKVYKEGITSIVAVLQTKKGKIYTGVNVKYHNIWKCICAERVAIAKAIEGSDIEFDVITSVKYFPEHDKFEIINMCGECRQIALEHLPFRVIVDNKGVLKSVSVEKILPYRW